MICPNCRQDAPTISRGLRLYCTACGAQRSLLNTSTPVNVAGRPVKLGGTLATILGLLVLFGGGMAALGLGAIFQAIWPAAVVGYVLGGIIGMVSLLFGVGLVFGGRKLRKTGDESTLRAREEAVIALAARRGGSVTPGELAQSISIPEPEADALLTEMAKRPDGRVTLEVDDDGTLRYFVGARGPGRRARVQESGRVRVPGPAPTRGRSAAEIEAEAEAEADREGAAARHRNER